MNKKTFSMLILLFLGVGMFVPGWIRASSQNLVSSLQETPILLEVPPLTQSQSTSCGESVIVMAYNYAHPQSPLNETDVIAFAEERGYFTETQEPFTSPVNMVKITRHYTLDYSSGNVLDADRALVLLISNLKKGNPIIIDVLTYLDDPQSSAHFVLVTGVTTHADDSSIIMIHYNNPLTGVLEVARWDGETGIWNAWQNNPDPGGSGWWLVIDTN
jgi:hypothetical protein